MCVRTEVNTSIRLWHADSADSLNKPFTEIKCAVYNA